MNDILRMAREAHHELVTQDYPGHVGQLDPWTMQLLERFAALVRADEREQCAKVAKETVCDTHLPTGVKIYGTIAAKAIRARKES